MITQWTSWPSLVTHLYSLAMLPTLRDLIRSLGADLAPVVPAGVPAADVPAVEVTAVHVSELADPTAFLDGGELLLTTGLGFQRSAAGEPPSVLWFSAYVQRLVSRGVAALAVGLGPVHAAIPEGLIDAAAKAGLPLLVVPPPTPFLAISRRYWSMVAASGQRELAEMLSAHRSLVAASLGTSPESGVLRRLAGVTGGWAAMLQGDGAVRAVWPKERRAAARDLQGAVRRLHAVGSATSVSLPVGADDVVVQPIGEERRLLGYLAVGHARPLPRQAQQLAMTAVALLTLVSAHAGRLRLAARGSEAIVLDLLRSGEAGAARRVATFLGLDLPDRARVALVSGGADPGEVTDELLLRLEGPPGTADRVLLAGTLGADCALLLADVPGCADWLASLIKPSPGARAALAAPAGLDRAAEAFRRADAALADAAAGTVADLGRADAAAPLDTPDLRAWAEWRLSPVADAPGLAATVAAVLRARSEQEAARLLGVHRHTIRGRIARAESLLGVSLDDPDTRAELWLALRLTGRG